MSLKSNAIKVIAIAWILLYLWQLGPIVNTHLVSGGVPAWFVDFAQLIFSVGPGGLLFLYSMQGGRKSADDEDTKEKERIERQRRRDEEFGDQKAEVDLPQRVNVREQIQRQTPVATQSPPVAQTPPVPPAVAWGPIPGDVMAPSPAPQHVPEAPRPAAVSGWGLVGQAQVRSYFGEQSVPMVKDAITQATSGMDATQTKEFAAGFSLCLELALNDQLDFEKVVIPPKTITVAGYTIQTKAFLKSDKFVEPPEQQEEEIVPPHVRKKAKPPPNGNGKSVRPIPIPQPPTPPAPIEPETDPGDEPTADPQAAPQEVVVQ